MVVRFGPPRYAIGWLDRRRIKLKRFLLSLAPFLLCIEVAFAQGDSLTANPVFRKDCAKCHGKTAEGRHFGGPSLTSPKVATATDEDLRKMISEGKGRMPKFAGKLTPAEIDTLVSEIKNSSRK